MNGQKTNSSPEHLARLAAEAAEFQTLACPETVGRYPINVDEVELTDEMLAGFPEWSAVLLCAGSKLERHAFQDGAVIVKLVNNRGLVIAARKQ